MSETPWLSTWGPSRSQPAERKARRTPEQILADALEDLLARSTISAEERERICLVPEATATDLRALARHRLTGEPAFRQAIKDAGLLTMAALARATPAEILALPGAQPELVGNMRARVLKAIERDRVAEARSQASAACVAKIRAQEALTNALKVLLKRSTISPEERDRTCLVPEADSDALERLATCKLGGDAATAPVRKRAGLTNYAALARATPAEIQVVPGMNDAVGIRHAVLDKIAELGAGAAEKSGV